MPNPNTCEVALRLSLELNSIANQLVEQKARREVTFESFVVAAWRNQRDILRAAIAGENVRMRHSDSWSVHTFSPDQIQERVERVRNLLAGSPPDVERKCTFPYDFYQEVELQAMVEGMTPDAVITSALITGIAADRLVYEQSGQ